MAGNTGNKGNGGLLVWMGEEAAKLVKRVRDARPDAPKQITHDGVIGSGENLPRRAGSNGWDGSFDDATIVGGGKPAQIGGSPATKPAPGPTKAPEPPKAPGGEPPKGPPTEPPAAPSPAPEPPRSGRINTRGPWNSNEERLEGIAARSEQEILSRMARVPARLAERALKNGERQGLPEFLSALNPALNTALSPKTYKDYLDKLGKKANIVDRRTWTKDIHTKDDPRFILTIEDRIAKGKEITTGELKHYKELKLKALNEAKSNEQALAKGTYSTAHDSPSPTSMPQAGTAFQNNQGGRGNGWAAARDLMNSMLPNWMRYRTGPIAPASRITQMGPVGNTVLATALVTTTVPLGAGVLDAKLKGEPSIGMGVTLPFSFAAGAIEGLTAPLGLDKSKANFVTDMYATGYSFVRRDQVEVLGKTLSHEPLSASFAEKASGFGANAAKATELEIKQAEAAASAALIGQKLQIDQQAQRQTQAEIDAGRAFANQFLKGPN